MFLIGGFLRYQSQMCLWVSRDVKYDAYFWGEQIQIPDSDNYAATYMT